MATTNPKKQALLSPTDDNVFPPAFFPEDLIEKILLRLPVRYLLQLRCVCKLWKTLISDPKFAEKHLLCSNADRNMTHQRLAFTFRPHAEELVSYPLNSLFENPSIPVIPDTITGFKRYEIIGSCDGLLCLYDIDQCSVILYNPSIRLKSEKSPNVASLDSVGWLFSYNGCGYDQVNGKYKVLVSLDNIDSHETLTKIYTFGEDSWRMLPNFPCIPNKLGGKYVCGTLNWVGYNKGLVGSNQHVILSFDMEKETYRDMLLPQNVGEGYMFRPLLYVLSNCLCVCFLSQTHSVVWLMREYGVVESWTKLTIIPRE